MSDMQDVDFTPAKSVVGFQMSCGFYTFFYQTSVKKHNQCTAGCSRSAFSAQQVHYNGQNKLLGVFY
jgi:hypothetical protein